MEAHPPVTDDGTAARSLCITWPHGVQEVFLMDDDAKPENRIYLIRSRDDPNERIPILGSELESLFAWWQKEKERKEGL